MDEPVAYYFGLCVLDALDQETRRTMRGTDAMRLILRRWSYRCMNMREPYCNLFLTRFKGLINNYFGPGEAEKLWDSVSNMYSLADTHMRQRATGGPYDFQPEEFEEFLRNFNF